MARWGHTACVNGSKLFVFGGTGNKVYGDCYIFDLVRNSWEAIETQGQVPTARFGHSCCPSPVSTKEFILFGGHGIGNKHYNEIHFFNTETYTWKRTSPDRTFPEARAGHTMTMFPSGKCVVFGGHSKSDRFFNSVHIFNYADMTWKKIERVDGDVPTPRGGHSAVAYNGELIVFGGFDGKKHFNDIHVLNLEQGVWRKVAVNGIPPTGRSGHTATMIDDKHLMVVGGCQNTLFLNDVHILQLETMTWVQPNVAGQALRARFRHTVTLVGRNQMLIFGGSSSGVLYNDLGALDVTLFVDPPPLLPGLVKSKKVSKRIGSNPVDAPSKAKYKLIVGSDEGSRHMSSPAEFSALVKDFAQQGVDPINRPMPTSSSASVPVGQPPTPSGVQLMQMFLSASMAYKEEHRLREQAETALLEVRKALFTEQKLVQKMEESRATLEADLVCEREDMTKLRAAKGALEKELKCERKKRKKAEEDNTRMDEELRRLKGAANREVEKRKVESSVELEELSKQVAELRLKIVDKKNKLRAMRKELSMQSQREKERLDEDKSYYSMPDFKQMGMDELLRLEEHYLSSLRIVGVAKQKQLQLQVEELQRAKAMLEEQKICSICADREIRVVLIPCGHRCLCRECSTVLTKCPICRKPVSDRIDTY
jgi:N-acetylneuraminic acid mutarotase